MGLLEMSAECEYEFINNWNTFTSPDVIVVQYPDRQSIGKDTLDEYIELNFIGLDDDLIGADGTTTGRVEYAGKFYVSCYHRRKKLALDLADKVTTFLRGKELPKNVNIMSNAQNSPTPDLDNDFYRIDVSFDIRQC